MVGAGKAPAEGRGGSPAALRICWTCLALPGALVLIACFLAPMALLAVQSFGRDGKNGAVAYGFGLANYASALTDSFYLKVLLETMALGVLVGALCVVLAYPVAYFLARTRSRWRGTLAFLAVMPLFISGVIRNVGWIPILGENGAVNVVLLKLHLIARPLPMINNFTGVVIGLVHALLPIMILMLMTVIQRVGMELEESALNLGASRWQLFCRVILPLTRRGVAAGFLLVFTLAVSSYTTPAIMGGGRVLVMSTMIAQQISFVLHYAFGSALTIVLFVAVVGLTMLSSRGLEGKARD
jgi:putative spermidine/putrescine transport system permease protein